MVSCFNGKGDACFFPLAWIGGDEERERGREEAREGDVVTDGGLLEPAVGTIPGHLHNILTNSNSTHRAEVVNRSGQLRRQSQLFSAFSVLGTLHIVLGSVSKSI